MNVTHRPLDSVPESIARAWGGVAAIVERGPAPTTFEVVFTLSSSNAQAPGGGGPVLGTF
ncbi:MAG: hypothetical protein HYR50_11595 [Candidatus Rokubacteria bacterium]|nr:hypothetical protein [Candidatus Rokubacteria bacterium]HLF49619.1 hypothetical protein [Methylomirabilota bacterium]